MFRVRAIEGVIAVFVTAPASMIALASPSKASFALWVLLVGLVVFSLYRASKATSAVNEADDSYHTLLRESIEHLPMPYVLYDDQDRLCVWNKHYEKAYAKVFDGLANAEDAYQLTFSDVLRINLEDTLSKVELDAYVKQRVKEHRSASSTIVDVQFPKLGWYRVSKYVTPSGGVAGFGIDVNELKHREQELMLEIERREKLEKEVRKIANTDQLTGVPNRRHFMSMAEHGFEHGMAMQASLSVLMIDIDYFKNINDTYGHACGDEVISTVAQLSSDLLKQELAHVGRVGGEEFAALLPDNSANGALRIAELLRKAIEAQEFIADGKRFTISVSIGVAECVRTDTDVMAAIQRADQALYAAKHAGRNCVRTFADFEEQRLGRTG